MSKYYDTVSVLKHKRVTNSLGKGTSFVSKFFPVFGSAVSRPKASFLASDHAANNPNVVGFSKQITDQTKENTREKMDTWEVEEAVAPVSEEQAVQVFIFLFL